MTAVEPSPLGKSTPVNPRVALIYGHGARDRLDEIQGLLQVMGAGRYFSVEEFGPVDPDQYNFYVVGVSVVDGGPDADVIEFVTQNRDWLCGKRVALIAFCRPGQEAVAALAELRDLLGDAVLATEDLCTDPTQPDPAAIVAIGARLHRLKEDGGRKLAPAELHEIVEAFLRRRKHCVLSTGYGDNVRGTSVSYTYHDGHVYIMCEGAGKFQNILQNNRVCVAMFAPPTAKSKVAGVQLTGRVRIHHPDTEEYRRISEIRGRDCERLRALPFILWALDISVEQVEFWWGDLTSRGVAPKQSFLFDEGRIDNSVR